MTSLALGDSSSCSNPLLDIFMSVNGVLTDVYELSFQIFDVSTSSKAVTPVQVYPATLGDRASVDVTLTCPAAGAGKVSTGRFVASWTVPTVEPVGTHRIKWFFKLTVGSPEQGFEEDFEVVSTSISAGDIYATVQDMRDEGVTVEQASDELLLKRIVLASKFIERATGQFFFPRPLQLYVDGRGGPCVLLNMPIISVATLAIVLFGTLPPTQGIAPESYKIYNRHLTQRLLSPDDRDNPKIELISAADPAMRAAYGWSPSTRLSFPRGQQNVYIDGVFGYTEYDANVSVGVTPFLINHVCKLIVMRELPQLANVADRDELQNRYRLTSERTRDQAYTLAPLGASSVGAFTGDVQIDRILASFSRPPMLGAV